MRNAVISEDKKRANAEKFVKMLEQIPEDVQEKAIWQIEGMVFCIKAQRAQEKIASGT